MNIVLVPRENVNDESVVIKAIHFQSGAQVQAGNVAFEIETSKTNIDVESPADGIIVHNLKVGMEISVGSQLFAVQDADGPVINSVEPSNDRGQNNQEQLLSNAAIARALELGVDIKSLEPTWVTKQDVEIFAGIPRKPDVIQQTIHSNNIKKTIKLSESHTIHGLSKRKQAEIQSLELGSHHSTSSTIGISIELPGERVVPPPYLFKTNISDILVFESAKLLKKYRMLNASHVDNKTWAEYGPINFGWSFDSGENLKVLTIRDADKLSLHSLQAEVERLLELYESGNSLELSLITGSTVTFSDLSRTESSFMLPLLNGAQSLILGLTSIKINQFSIFATFDHRVSEGLQVSKFLSELKLRILSYFYSHDGHVKLKCYVCEKSISEEVALGNRGFINVTLPNGVGANLCRNCYEGW